MTSSCWSRLRVVPCPAPASGARWPTAMPASASTRHCCSGRRGEFEAKARALLASVGLAGYEDKFPWQLSGGMQQRASICRALVHAPQMLLLDEPFGALDAFTREDLWCTLRDLHAAQRFNVILVTHDLRESADPDPDPRSQIPDPCEVNHDTLRPFRFLPLFFGSPDFTNIIMSF